MKLTGDQLQRYSRQLILSEVGEEGQARLLKAKVCIVGAGGLGSPAGYYLAAAGVGIAIFVWFIVLGLELSRLLDRALQ